MSTESLNDETVYVVHILLAFDSNTTIVTDSANVQITVSKENNVLQETDHKLSKESKCNESKEAFDICIHHILQSSLVTDVSFIPEIHRMTYGNIWRLCSFGNLVRISQKGCVLWQTLIKEGRMFRDSISSGNFVRDRCSFVTPTRITVKIKRV